METMSRDQINYPMLLISSIVFLLANCASANKMIKPGISNCEKCDSKVLYLVSSTQFDSNQIFDFFCAMDESCTNNVEFSEVSNEILFKIFLIEPERALKLLNDNKEFSINYILKELTEPINDGINVRSVYSNVDKVKGYDVLKKQVLKSLQEAISKY